MKKTFLYIIIITSGITCNTLPHINNTNPLYVQNYPVNYNPFLKNKTRLIHSIKADLPNGEAASIIGITVADPDLKTIHAVIMTIEGLVLFEGNYKNNAVTINRGIPPFDSADFASGVMNDICLIYFQPEGKNPETGWLENGSFVRRFNCDNTIFDVISNQDGTGVISMYECGFRLKRTVKISMINQMGFPETFELQAHGIFGYSLYLELIQVEEIK